MSALVFTGALFCVSTFCTAGGIEFRETDTLPYVENILFSPSSVGIVSQDGRLFRIDRKTQDVHQLDAQTFALQFPKPWPPKPSDPPRSAPNILRTTSGEEFEQTPGSCDEGVDEAHVLRYRQHRFPDVLKPCSTVMALEIIGPQQLWLGTAEFDEGGDGKAEGIVVQALHKRQKIQSITSKSGLTGGVIRMLRNDPISRTVWVATERGINQIDRRFRVTWSRYWYEEFEPSSRKSQIRLSATPKSSDPFAVLGRELDVDDWVAFSRAVEQIPFTERSNVRLYDFHMSGPPRKLSPDLNNLVPFFLQATQSNVEAVRSFGLWNFCKFDDPRVRTFLATMAPNTVKASADHRSVQECLEAWAAQP